MVRYGDDVFVVWDSEDVASDLNLMAAWTLCRALCVRRQATSEAQEADFAIINEAILEIEKQLEKLGEIKKWTETIQSNSEKILERMRISKKSIRNQIETLNERISDLKRVVAVMEDGCEM